MLFIPFKDSDSLFLFYAYCFHQTSSVMFHQRSESGDSFLGSDLNRSTSKMLTFNFGTYVSSD